MNEKFKQLKLYIFKWEANESCRAWASLLHSIPERNNMYITKCTVSLLMCNLHINIL